MDKYEYRVRADEIKNLISERKYKEAVEIADTIDWKNVHNSRMLCTISDLYKMCKRYEDSRDVLLLAYQRNPQGRLILYSLCELSIKLNDVPYAVEYYKEYAQVAPRDPGIYILKYKLYTAQEVGLDERIQVLEDLQQLECKEKWMYELAYLYHRIGYGAKCVEECNQIILFFGEGRYVIKALELKQLHEPLSGEQDLLYRRLTGPSENDVLVKEMDISKYNTIDLQKELANSLKEVLYDDTAQIVPAPAEDLQATQVSMAPTQAEEALYEEEPVYEEVTEVQKEETEATADTSENYDDFRYTDEELMALNKPATDETIVFNPQKAYDRPSYNVNFENPEESAEKEPVSDMKVVLPESYNGKNPFVGYDDMVSLEGDGQLSFVVPDEEVVDKQITGQISIEDVLTEWERMKNESEKKWREDVRRRVLEQTDGIFKTFDETARAGLLERLEVSVNESSKVELTEEETKALEKENEEHGGLNIDVAPVEEAVPVMEVTNPVTETFETVKAATEAGLAAAVVAEVAEAADNKEAAVSHDMHEIYFEEEPEIEEVPSDTVAEPEKEEVPSDMVAEPEIEEALEETAEESAESEPAAEELTFDRTPYMEESIASEEPVAEKTATEETVEDKIYEEEPVERHEASLDDSLTDDYLMKFAEAGEERDYLDKVILNDRIASIEMNNIEGYEEVTAEEPVEEVQEEAVAEAEEVTEESAEETTEEPIDDVESETEEAVTEAVADTEVTEEIVAEVETETAEVPVEESAVKEVPEEPEAKEAAEEPAVEEVTEEPAAVEVPAATGSKHGFTPEQEDRFESYIYTELGAEQLENTLNNMTMDATKGNMIIGAEDIDSAVELGKSIITELSERDEITGKVAKIKASTLNAKDAEGTFEKLVDGALIIQNANELRRETLDVMRRALNVPGKRMFVVLTMPHRAKHKFIMENSDMLENFTISFDVEALDNSELVNFARKYAYSREFGIDEMGMLALHTRIDENQTNAHSVTITEVKEIIDEAIEHACKKNMGHFLDVVVGKRYDNNDMIVLREKDFQKK